jgi:hypothetical protein
MPILGSSKMIIDQTAQMFDHLDALRLSPDSVSVSRLRQVFQTNIDHVL